MLTITSFINFIGSLFNCALNICIFSIIDELKFKPEKGIELSDTLRKYFPIELMIISFNLIIALFYRNYFQIIVCLPIFLYDLKL